MAVEHNMAELDNTWWDLLQKIAVNLNWAYAALWTLTADGRNLIWKQGYFHMRSNDDANIGELFYSLYSSCTFTHGVGFAGHALAHKASSILWVTGDELERLEHPVVDQTCFLKAAGIQTIVCLPLLFPSSSFVLELGTVSRVRDTEDLAHDIKKVLLHLLTGGLPNLMKDSGAVPDITAAADQFLAGQVRALNQNQNPSSSLAMSLNDTRLMEPTRTSSMSFSPRSLGEGIILKAQRQLESNIYSELMHPVGHDESFAMHVDKNILSVVPPQLSVDVPQLHGSPEQSPTGTSMSPWASESSLLQMELNAFQSWTSMAEATTTLDAELHGMRGTSSATSSRLAGEIVDLNDDIGQMIPFSTSTLDQFMAVNAADEQHQRLMGPGGSRRGSSSRSSASLRSQTVEDTEISSGNLVTYADRHISELKSGPRAHVGNPAVSSGTTVPAESESYWRGGAQWSSEPSSKENSPESNLTPPRHGYGIHPRISSATTRSLKDQQQRHLNRHPSDWRGSAFASGSHVQQQQQQSLERLERQHSSSLEQTQQREDMKPGPSSAADSTPRLVQFGNVLQLGNAAGQVTEALPQEHDEAARIHMLAERRRRTKQNENFSQLKFLIPTAPKMDKASVLAATIAYIHELKDRVKDLEQNNQSLKQQLIGQEQDQSGSEGPLIGTRARENPTTVRGVRSPKSLSPTDVDRIQASPDGDGNLKIEISHTCGQADTAIHIFACLKDMHFKVINANVAINDNRIHASIIVKMKRKNSAGQSAVCAEVEHALTVCLNNLA